MNKIKFLLCFALLVSGVEGRGQIYINSYRFGEAAPNILLLDSISGSGGAWSLRKLDADYSGNCIEVLKDSVGDATQNIGFVDNYLDTVALKNFCKTNSCRVRTWYDQSGNTRNFQQTTKANMPTIVNNGNIIYRNNKPAIDFDGTNDAMSVATSTTSFNFLHNGNRSAVAYVGITDKGTFSTIATNNGTGSDGSTGFALYIEGTYKIGNAISRSQSGTFVVLNLTATNSISNSAFLAYLDLDPANATVANRSYIYTNNATAVQANTSSGTSVTANASFNMFIGTSSTGLYIYDGGMQELIFWDGNKTSNRTYIQSDINTFYSVY